MQWALQKFVAQRGLGESTKQAVLERRYVRQNALAVGGAATHRR